ncbi:MAG TPA: glycoside hydrolase domain-containing protein [Nonomuraea sp.]|nr:glycoside hydrolase domain-containing protein [Nonomuraea sp.]
MRSRPRLLGPRTGITALMVAVAASGLVLLDSTGPAEAETRRMPGSFTGFAFDACQAPDQASMDVWRERSPYWGVGIYTSGTNRFCAEQEHLSASWVDTQARRGWVLLPLHVGLQASCTRPDRWAKIDPDPADGYAAARAQGRDEAAEAVAAAASYGIGRGSTLWYDLEHFDVSRDACRESALSLVTGWTRALHDAGYRSGFYSSASSGIRMLEQERREPSGHTLPDQLWIAEWNGRATTRSGYVGDDGWARDRVHQYRGGHDETYGGVTLNIDSNVMDVGGGTRPGRAAPHCGVRIDFPTYPRLGRGDRGDHVRAAQCLLRRQGLYDGRLHGRYTPATARAVRRFSAATVGLPTGPALTGRAWTALLSRGADPVVKYGSGGNDVRRLQRSLNAAVRARLPVDGVFAGATRAAVRDYQRSQAMARTGVAEGRLWARLQQGRR